MAAPGVKQRRVFVVGVGMTPFVKPRPNLPPFYTDMVELAVSRALTDAGNLDVKAVDNAVLGRLMATAGSGQRSLYRLGVTGIPIFNVANACATGSNALYMSKVLIGSGMSDVCMAVGVEEMAPGPLMAAPKPKDPNAPKGPPKPRNPQILDDHLDVLRREYGEVSPNGPPLPQMFARAAEEHMKMYGTTAKQLAMVGEKNHRHSANNPYSQFQQVYTLKEIEESPMIFEPLTKLQCSPTSDGAACAILMSEEAVKKYGLEGQAVEILAQTSGTHGEGVLNSPINERSSMDMVGSEMAKRAADDLYKQSGLKPDDVDVIELHDCFASNEIFTYEALGLCAPGEGGKLIESGQTTYGGKWVVNPSGGLISKGHPIGATGVAQCCELSWQLRGEAGPRQVPGKDGGSAKVALQHNLGLPGNVVMTMYRKPEEWKDIPKKATRSGAMGFGQQDKDFGEGKLQSAVNEKANL